MPTIISRKNLLNLGSGLFISTVIYCLLAIFTFNPISNYHEVNEIKIIADLALSKSVGHQTVNQNFYKQLALSKQYVNFIENRGLDFQLVNNELILTLPIGFDNFVSFNGHKNCWQGNQWILFLPKCA